MLQQSVCTISLRDPITRAVSAFYEFHHTRTTNLTAPEYLRAHGAAAFATLVNNNGQTRWAGEHWPAVFESCVVGTTELADDYFNTLARVIKTPAGTRGLKLRAREKTDMQTSDWPVFYSALTPHFTADLELWRFGFCIAQAQHRAAQAFPKLISDEDEEELFSSSCHNCVSGGSQKSRSSWQKWTHCEGRRALGKGVEGGICARVDPEPVSRAGAGEPLSGGYRREP